MRVPPDRPAVRAKRRRYRYDFALSFAGEQRAYVDAVAGCLTSHGVKVFYDVYEEARLAGRDLYVHLVEVYRDYARRCVIFASADYARKVWPNHERRAAQERALHEVESYIIPARFDATAIPGLLGTTKYIDLTKYSPAAFCGLLLEILNPRKDRASGVSELAMEAFRKPLLESVARHFPEHSNDAVDSAFDKAVSTYGHTVTLTGHPLVLHPIGTAQIVADLGFDPSVVCAALAQLDPRVRRRSSGARGWLAEAVDALSDLIDSLTYDPDQVPAIRRLVIAKSGDPLALVVKLAERLHLMRTLYSIPARARKRTAAQALQIYAPIAKYLGLRTLQQDLEDLAFEVLQSSAYAETLGRTEARRRVQEKQLGRLRSALSDALLGAGVRSVVEVRPRHLYSVWKRSQSLPPAQRAPDGRLRVLVEDLGECYATLGIVHRLWPAVPGTFDDFIALPKPNLYQALHTTVDVGDGRRLDVQIQSLDQHVISEVGVAARWDEVPGTREGIRYAAQLAWLRHMVSWERDSLRADPDAHTSAGHFGDRVYVFTHTGEVRDLPTAATALDLAYSIHTEVGDRATGAIVNNRPVGLSYLLANGEIVEILVADEEQPRSMATLGIVHTSRARRAVRRRLSQDARAGLKGGPTPDRP